jgi:hypothetical protein
MKPFVIAFNHYPGQGPRLGAAYQINAKTVLRMGAGLAYGTAPNQANLAAAPTTSSRPPIGFGSLPAT